MNERANDFYFGLDDSVIENLKNKEFRTETKLTTYLKGIIEVINEILYLTELNLNNKDNTIDEVKYYLLSIDEVKAKENTNYLANYIKQSLRYEVNGLIGLDLYFKDNFHLNLFYNNTLRIREIIKKHIEYRSIRRLEI